MSKAKTTRSILEERKRKERLEAAYREGAEEAERLNREWESVDAVL